MIRCKDLGWLPTKAGLAAACLLGLSLALGQADEIARSPIQVKIRDEQAAVVDVGSSAPIDPVPHIRFMAKPQLDIGVTTEQGQQLHLSHTPGFNIDGQFTSPFNGGLKGRMEAMNQKLPKTASGKDRNGFMNIYVQGDMRLTQSIELVPTKPAARGQKRQLDAVMVRYVMENKGKQAHKMGLRVYIDVYIIDNDGALFAAPTIPNKILDGIELKGKTLPEYLQILQRPNLQNPGYVAHVSLNLGSPKDRPDRLVMTRHGMGFNTWDMMPAMAGGDSALGIFWEPKEIAAGGKREITYAYGKGIAIAPENEGRFNLVLGGSFEPGKLFSIAAYVQDPAPGQALTLELPPGMERMEGKEIQPVNPASEDRPESVVLWKARVLRTGEYPVRVRSSTGLTHTKMITISNAADAQ